MASLSNVPCRCVQSLDQGKPAKVLEVLARLQRQVSLLPLQMVQLAAAGQQQLQQKQLLLQLQPPAAGAIATGGPLMWQQPPPQQQQLMQAPLAAVGQSALPPCAQPSGTLPVMGPLPGLLPRWRALPPALLTELSSVPSGPPVHLMQRPESQLQLPPPALTATSPLVQQLPPLQQQHLARAPPAGPHAVVGHLVQQLPQQQALQRQQPQPPVQASPARVMPAAVMGHVMCSPPPLPTPQSPLLQPPEAMGDSVQQQVVQGPLTGRTPRPSGSGQLQPTLTDALLVGLGPEQLHSPLSPARRAAARLWASAHGDGPGPSCSAYSLGSSGGPDTGYDGGSARQQQQQQQQPHTWGAGGVQGQLGPTAHGVGPGPGYSLGSSGGPDTGYGGGSARQQQQQQQQPHTWGAGGVQGQLGPTAHGVGPGPGYSLGSSGGGAREQQQQQLLQTWGVGGVQGQMGPPAHSVGPGPGYSLGSIGGPGAGSSGGGALEQHLLVGPMPPAAWHSADEPALSSLGRAAPGEVLLTAGQVGLGTTDVGCCCRCIGAA